jgi:hypothetical protein
MFWRSGEWLAKVRVGQWKSSISGAYLITVATAGAA